MPAGQIIIVKLFAGWSSSRKEKTSGPIRTRSWVGRQAETEIWRISKSGWLNILSACLTQSSILFYFLKPRIWKVFNHSLIEIDICILFEYFSGNSFHKCMFLDNFSDNSVSFLCYWPADHGGLYQFLFGFFTAKDGHRARIHRIFPDHPDHIALRHLPGVRFHASFTRHKATGKRGRYWFKAML